MELAIIGFISRFKNAVLGDPRLILLGSTAFEESLGKRLDDEPEDDSKIPDYVSPYQRIDNESQTGLDSIAQMMENKDL
jgi:hypothetical protein